MAVRGTMHFIFYLFPFFFAILTKLFLKASFIAFNAMCTLQSYKSDDSISAKNISIKVSNEFIRGFLQFALPILSQLKSNKFLIGRKHRLTHDVKHTNPRHVGGPYFDHIASKNGSNKKNEGTLLY